MTDNANARQVGGQHYKKHAHEPWDVITDWGLGYLDGNAVKYLSRWRSKGGLQDLEKARHYNDKLIENERDKGLVAGLPGTAASDLTPRQTRKSIDDATPAEWDNAARNAFGLPTWKGGA